MLIVNVQGGTAQKRQLAEDLCYFVAQRYKFSPKKEIEIDVNIKSIDGAQGFCMDCDDGLYEIEIDNKITGDDFITCVLHELVHVKQYVKKELHDCGCVQMYKKVAYETDMNYLDKPWEKEAYKMQVVLLEEYKNAS